MTTLLYTQKVYLDREEQQAIGRAYLSGDTRAKETLITAAQRMIPKLARKYRQSSHMADDLFQVGYVAILEALNAYDPDRGGSFTGVAWRYIQSAMQREVVYRGNAWSGTSVHTRVYMRDVRLVEEDLMQRGIEPTNVRVAEVLGIDERFVTLMRGYDPGFEDKTLEPVGEDETRDVLFWEKFEAVVAGLRPKISAQETVVLERRILDPDPVTLAELGEEMGMTRQGVNMIEKRLMAKIKKAMGVK
jgi:RNA polymerase sigma factor (sigma-70 family)